MKLSAQIVVRLIFVGACGAAAAIFSAYLAAWLFTINAPNADKIVREGWGFNLYNSLVAGGVAGALGSIGLIVRRHLYCLSVGCLSSVFLLLRMPALSKNDFWEGPDLLALPVLISIALCAYGIRLRRRSN